MSSEQITDLYVSGTRMRLREARPLSGGPALLRLSRKADIDAQTRLITSIYLPEDEFEVLARSLSGKKIHKLRHRFAPKPGVVWLADEFQGALAGLYVAEAEFKTRESMSVFTTPEFAVREITEDHRFTGGCLVEQGLPVELQELLKR